MGRWYRVQVYAICKANRNKRQENLKLSKSLHNLFILRNSVPQPEMAKIYHDVNYLVVQKKNGAKQMLRFGEGLCMEMGNAIIIEFEALKQKQK